MNRRAFNRTERNVMYVRAGGKCEMCGAELDKGWHADHKHPFSKGGSTDLTNGAALCPTCNLKKGNSIMSWPFPFEPRIHQQDALRTAILNIEKGKRKIVLEHCVGAGKTITAWMIDDYLRHEGFVDTTVYFAPRKSLISGAYKTFAQSVELNTPNGNETPLIHPGTKGYVSTFQALQNDKAGVHSRAQRGKRVHLIIDEAHFAGDGIAVAYKLNELIQMSVFVTIMTATLVRSDASHILGITYDEDEYPTSDHAFSFRDGIANTVIRKVEVSAINADIEWNDDKKESIENVEERLKHLLTGNGKAWRPIADAFINGFKNKKQLNPREKGIVFAATRKHADQIHKYLKLSGVRSVVAVSSGGELDEFNDDGVAALNKFPFDDYDVIVTVGMAGVGYDAPRIGSILMLSHIRHSPHMMQQIGRGLRIDRDSSVEAINQICHIYAPQDKRMVEFMETIEKDSKMAAKERELCPGCAKRPCECPCYHCGMPRNKCECPCRICHRRPCVCEKDKYAVQSLDNVQVFGFDHSGSLFDPARKQSLEYLREIHPELRNIPIGILDEITDKNWRAPAESASTIQAQVVLTPKERRAELSNQIHDLIWSFLLTDVGLGEPEVQSRYPAMRSQAVKKVIGRRLKVKDLSEADLQKVADRCLSSRFLWVLWNDVASWAR